MAVEYPKRSLKRNQNREQFVRSAVRLFATAGYDSTTLSQVAEEAGLHVQTLYRHFKSKEDLAIAGAELVVRGVRDRFASAPAEYTTFQIWREISMEALSISLSRGFGEHKIEQLRSASSLMHDSFQLIIYSACEDLLTEYLARDFRMDPRESRLPRLVACMLWSGNEAAMKRCSGLDGFDECMDDDSAVIAESTGVIDDIEKLFAHMIVEPPNERKQALR